MPDLPAGPPVDGWRHPSARRGGDTNRLHGVVVPDPYRWLEDRDRPDTQRWCTAQDELWADIRASLPDLAGWREQVSSYLDVNYSSAPIQRGAVRFAMCYPAGSQRPQLLAQLPGSSPRNLLEGLPPALARAGGLQSWQPSFEGDRVALAVSARGSEDASLYLMDVATGQLVDEPIPGCSHTSVAWLPGGHALYYARSDPVSGRLPPGGPGMAVRRVYRRRVGSPLAADELAFEDLTAPDAFYSLLVRQDGRWLVISGSDGSPAAGNDLWLADLGSADAASLEFRHIQVRNGSSSGVTFGPDQLLYILTNAGAPNWRIVVADPRQAEPEHWRELVPADPAAVISDFAILTGQDDRSGTLLVARSRDAISELAVHDLVTGLPLRAVRLPALGTIGPLMVQAGDTDRAWFSYTDCTTAPTVLECRASTGSVTELAPVSRERAAALGQHRQAGSGAETHRLRCTSADGTSIQIIAVRPTDATGPLPTILGVYGGFGVSYPPSYSVSTMAWVRAGGSFVIANVRGGGERGEAWHAAGRRHGKQNSIDDLLAAAAYLIEAGYTAPEQLAIWGVSHGGLLVAAAVTQRPDYFAAAVCTSPLCDMVRYEMSGRGAIWRSEFGSAENSDDFHHLIGYSPYHHVTNRTAYPAVLFTTAEQDDRVDAFHARKMCAALQMATTGVRPIALRREHNVSHSGRSFGRTVALTSEALAFVAKYTGMTWFPCRIPGVLAGPDRGET